MTQARRTCGSDGKAQPLAVSLCTLFLYGNDDSGLQNIIQHEMFSNHVAITLLLFQLMFMTRAHIIIIADVLTLIGLLTL